MALNDNIKKFREEKNLTQQQLADKLYVSRQTVCRWENGSRCPDLIMAKKLACKTCFQRTVHIWTWKLASDLFCERCLYPADA